MITLEAVSLDFGEGPVLQGVSLEAPRGGALALVGAGGAGKTLILKLVCGLLRPTAGRVIVDGVEVSALDERALVPLRQRVGMVFQSYALFDGMTVGENVAFPLVRRGLPTAEIQARVEAVLAQVYLKGAAHLSPGALSGGMRKRVSLARALVHEPEILLCDDPTAGLDPVTTRRIFDLLADDHRRRGTTLICVSHACGPLLELCSSVVMLAHGEVMFAGSGAEATSTKAPAETREFLLAGARR